MSVYNLIRYEALIVWRQLTSLFRQASDTIIAVVTLPLILLLGIAFYQDRLEASIDKPAYVAGLVSFVLFGAFLKAIARRLVWHRAYSVMARLAYGRAAIAYQFVLLVPAILLLIWACFFFAIKGSLYHFYAVFAAAVAGGMVVRPLEALLYQLRKLQLALPLKGSRKRVSLEQDSRQLRLFEIVARTISFNFCSSLSLAALLTLVGVLFGCAYRMLLTNQMTQAFSIAAISVASLPIIFKIAVQNHQTFIFLRINGIHPFQAILPQTLFMFIYTSSITLSMFLLSNQNFEVFIGGATFLFGFIWFVTLRAGYCAISSVAAANLALQFEIVILAIVAWIMLPAIVPLIAYRVYVLEKQVRSKMWIIE
jgi:hypothetical protein